jgi:hypothetical protein
MELDAPARRDVRKAKERNIMCRHDERPIGDRRHCEAWRVHEICRNANRGPPQAMPELVTHAPVRPAGVDPRHAFGNVVGPRPGRKRDCIDTEVVQAGEDLDFIPPDPARNGLQELAGVKRDLHRATRR